MVQYSVWSNCSNSCDFCLRREREFYTLQKQLDSIAFIKKNINFIDWKHEYSYGISLLGGEIYYIQNKQLQNAFMDLINDIITKILLVSQNPDCKYSSVTNGLYDPVFLFKVIDLICDKVGLEKIDLNFSYDLKYRYKSDYDRQLVLNNIKKFHTKYNYIVGVQMILTQHLINQIKNGKFNLNKFIEQDICGNTLSFLYPHPIHTGKILNDFFFSRKDFLWFLQYLKNTNSQVYLNTIYSTKNSGIFKYTGFKHKDNINKYDQQPVLSDGKEIINACGHSILYKCYSDSDKCMLCDILALENI